VASKIRSLLEAGGARVEVLNPEEHDEIMAVVQALTHFAYIGIGATLQALDFDVEKSRKFMSPVYEIMIDFVAASWTKALSSTPPSSRIPRPR